jgi:biotin synthase
MTTTIAEHEILRWLREDDPQRLNELWERADSLRAERVGPAVHLRGLVEVSNHCARKCGYCGISACNPAVIRYRMSADEVLACAHEAARYGYGTLVMQAGEDYGLPADWVADVVARVKAETPLAVTLSLGERQVEDIRRWKQAGADRYLLRFETSDPELYSIIHPRLDGTPGLPSDRLNLLEELRGLGFEIGSGVMVGIPGQSFESLAHDIALFGALDLDMIGVGPYIPHPQTPLGRGELALLPEGEQVPNTELMCYKAVALTRLACPEGNIPSTTALATINQEQGRELGLTRGANVVMPNLTPVKYRALYEIYPGKACISETGQACNSCITMRIFSIGRELGTGQGGRRRAETEAR